MGPKALLISLVALLLPLNSAEAGQTCKLRLTTAGRHAWTITASDGKISGDKTKLTVEDGIIYGFLFAKQTRLRLEPDRISGRLAGLQADLHVETGADHLLLRGPVGGVRTLVKLNAEAIDLTAQDLEVALDRKPARPGEPDGPVDYVDSTGMVRLTLSGCEPADLLDRPGLLAVVNWLVHNTDQILPIAPTTSLPPGRAIGPMPTNP